MLRAILLAALLVQGKSAAATARPVVQSTAAEVRQGDVAKSAKQDTAKSTAPIAHPSPAPEERIADYTRWLTWFTAALVVFTAVLAGVSYWQGRLINKEFLATHRPRLRIRQVEYRDPNPDSSDPFIQYVVANVGDTEGKIVEAVGADWDGNVDGRTRVPQSIRRIAKNPGVTLKSGESVTLTYEKDIFLRTRFAERLATKKPIVFLCVLKYTDGLGTTRETSALRWLCEPDAATTRFIDSGYDGEGYEYED